MNSRLIPHSGERCLSLEELLGACRKKEWPRNSVHAAELCDHSSPTPYMGAFLRQIEADCAAMASNMVAAGIHPDAGYGIGIQFAPMDD